MKPVLAFVVRDLRKYLRQPHLIVISVALPLLQFVVIGHAIGGKIREVPIAMVSHDSGPPAVEVLERLRAVESTTRLFRVLLVPDEGRALRMLREGEVAGVVILAPDYSARTYRGEIGGVGFVIDNTDLFVAAALDQGLRRIVLGGRYEGSGGDLEIVELFPFVNYLQYLTPGAVMAAIYIACFIGGGGITFLSDRIAGRHEGYLAAPVHRFHIAGGLMAAATVKALLAAILVTPAVLWIARCAEQITPASAGRLAVVLVISAAASTSFLTALTVRLRSLGGLMILNGVANMVLFFPSGALYPIAGFPWWLKGIAKIDPFTYIVQPIRVVLFKNGNWAAISEDLLVLIGIGLASFVLACATLPRRV